MSVMNINKFSSYKMANGHQDGFNPYESNGGSIVAIGGDSFAIIACDLRLSSGYSIHTRSQSKLFQLTPKTILGSSGCWCDVIALADLVKARMQMYMHYHLRTMPTEATAQMLSVIMYNKRFFPYYVSNILAGLDSKGMGVVYSYDPIGNVECSRYKSGGSACALLQPILDNQIGLKNISSDKLEAYKLTKERAIGIAVDVFKSAAERDIYTGDGVQLSIITGNGIEVKTVPLRTD